MRCHSFGVVVSGLVFCSLLFGQASRPAEVSSQPEAEQLPAQLRDIGIDQKLNAQIPLDAVFRDESGQEVKLAEYFDGKKPVILALVYYKCPMLCTLVLNDLLRCLRAVPELGIGKDFRILSVSFNPREGPELAAAKKTHYVTEYSRGRNVDVAAAEAGWHFLTGEQGPITELTSAVGFRYRFDPKFNEYAHPSAVIILTPQGKVARYYLGLGYQPKDIRLSLVEASNNQIGGISEQFLLYCFHYDPASGKYSLAVMRAVKVGAVLILVAMGAMFWILHRKQQRRKREQSAKV